MSIDNVEVRGGADGGTIVVAADNVTLGTVVHTFQYAKLADGDDGGTVAARVSPTGELHVFLANNGTVVPSGLQVVHLDNSATVTAAVSGAVLVGNAATVVQGAGDGIWNVFRTNDATVSVAGNLHVGNSATVTVAALPGSLAGIAEDAAHGNGDPGIPPLVVRRNEPASTTATDGDYGIPTADSVGALWTHLNDGTVAVKGNVHVGNDATVTATVTGTPNVHVTNSATVIQGTDPWTVAIAGAVLVGNLATVTLSGTNPVFQTNDGTVTVSAGFVNAHVTNSATVIQGTDPWTVDGAVTVAGNVLVGNNATVTVSSGDVNAHVSNQATVTAGSAVVGLGWTLGGTHFSLAASGTIVPAVSGKRLRVYSESFTSSGGTVLARLKSGAGGGTVSGPRKFVDGGGVARANPLHSPIYSTAQGSALYMELTHLVGTGTVSGDVAWIEET